MANKIRISGKWIGDGEPCFIIAEAGSNHNGNLQQAKHLIEVAADAKADAVKFQLFRASKLYAKNAGQSEYLNLDRSINDIISDMEIPYDWLPELATHCETMGIIFLSSAFDEESVNQLEPFVPAYKIASYEMTHLPLVRHIAAKGKPVIISTGTANSEEVDETVTAFYGMGNQKLIIMQCTASYPAPLESLNLRAIPAMKTAYNLPVGLSDHSREALVGPMAAVALGGNLIEKHFTLSNLLPGPDHKFAVEPCELRSMVKKVREVERSLGSGKKVVHPVEAELRGFARRSIFATQNIEIGEILNPANVEVLRCGNLAPGIEPKYYETVLGKPAVRRIVSGSAVQPEDYA